MRESNLAATWQPLPSPGRGFCFHALFAMNRNARAHQGRLAWLCLKAAQPGTLCSLANRSKGVLRHKLHDTRFPSCALLCPFFASMVRAVATPPWLPGRSPKTPGSVLFAPLLPSSCRILGREQGARGAPGVPTEVGAPHPLLGLYTNSPKKSRCFVGQKCNKSLDNAQKPWYN